ncbi:hypothetical protein H4582DRAFT_2032647 [Lactarius indigo]|nr:hypothetical protein H4582DRAFT_2032647 [Lactarius indigo]
MEGFGGETHLRRSLRARPRLSVSIALLVALTLLLTPRVTSLSSFTLPLTSLVISSIALTLSLMPYVISKFLTTTTLISSCVSMSNLLSAFSTSVHPTSIFRNFLNLLSFISFVTRAKINSTSAMTLHRTSIMADVSGVPLYILSRCKKPCMCSKRLASVL